MIYHFLETNLLVVRMIVFPFILKILDYQMQKLFAVSAFTFA